jgi:hypothetical protein
VLAVHASARVSRASVRARRVHREDRRDSDREWMLNRISSRENCIARCV